MGVNEPQSSNTESTTSGPVSVTVESYAVDSKTNLPINNQHKLEEELNALRESESRLKQDLTESQRRERILSRRLATKENELQDYASQITELKSTQANSANLRCTLLDPAVNILFQKLKTELKLTKDRLEETQNELSAWKFTPDSNTGKRLMAKCRLLYQENEELGKMTANGRIAKLENELTLHKTYCEEVKKSQSEIDEILQDLDEDVEGMQSTILILQRELKTYKEKIDKLQIENASLKSLVSSGTVTNNEDKTCDNRTVLNCTIKTEQGFDNDSLSEQPKNSEQSNSSVVTGDELQIHRTTQRTDDIDGKLINGDRSSNGDHKAINGNGKIKLETDDNNDMKTTTGGRKRTHSESDGQNLNYPIPPSTIDKINGDALEMIKVNKITKLSANHMVIAEIPQNCENENGDPDKLKTESNPSKLNGVVTSVTPSEPSTVVN